LNQLLFERFDDLQDLDCGVRSTTVKAVCSGDGPAIARFRSHHPRLKDVTPARLGADAKLSGAQWVIAREYGFASWSS